MNVTIVLNFILLALVLLAMVWVVSRQQTKRLQSRGLLPEPGEVPTVEHVKRLAAAGETIQAIKIYREIYHVGLKEAKDAVENLGVG